MNDLGYLSIDKLRERDLVRALESLPEKYEGFRVLPKLSAAERVRQRLALEAARHEPAKLIAFHAR